MTDEELARIARSLKESREMFGDKIEYDHIEKLLAEVRRLREVERKVLCKHPKTTIENYRIKCLMCDAWLSGGES